MNDQEFNDAEKYLAANPFATVVQRQGGTDVYLRPVALGILRDLLRPEPPPAPLVDEKAKDLKTRALVRVWERAHQDELNPWNLNHWERVYNEIRALL